MSTINPLPGGKYEIIYDDGARYTGEMINNRITGQGRMEYADGRIYEGTFSDGRWDGYGNAYFPSNNSRYEGIWSNNLREGKGQATYYNEDGSVFAFHSADFHNDIIDGHLRSEFSDGTVVEGYSFKGYVPTKDIVISYGSKYFDEKLRFCQYKGSVTYENNWYVRNGKGRLTDSEGVVYEGQFLHDMRHGHFTITYRGGYVEEAEFINDVRQDSTETTNKKPDSPKQETKPKAEKPADQKQASKAKAENKPADNVIAKKLNTEDDRYLHVKFKENDDYARELKPYFKGIIGMDSVKDQLDRMYKRFKIDAMRKAQLGLNSAKQGYYFIITGNPGTGKTTVARIIGKMLRDLDILAGDVFVEVDRSKLVGQYIGQTAIQTSEVIQSARGGTLFIDEAYSLFRRDDEKDFGAEAVDTLLKDMEDHRGEYCCILAGYEDRMDEMIKYANPGLASRFDHKINIGDYSSEELLDIIVTMAEDKYFFIKKEAKPVILKLFDKERSKPTFANARFARKILDEAIEAQALRLSDLLDERKGGTLKAEELQTLEASDFMDADGL